MAQRTYIPALKAGCKALQRFITKYKTKLEENLGEEGYALLVAVLDAVEAILFWLDTTSNTTVRTALDQTL